MDECIEWQHYRNKDGYGRTGKGLVHRLAFEEFWGVNLPRRLLVLHDCDNPACCRIEHLYIGTHADNMRDKVARQRQGKGSQIVQARLTERTAREAMDRLQAGESQASVAAAYGVHQHTMSDLWRGERWGYLFSSTFEERRTQLLELRKNLAAAGHKRTLSAEHRANMAAAQRGKSLSEETRAKISASCLGRQVTSEQKARIAATMKLRVQDRTRDEKGRLKPR